MQSSIRARFCESVIKNHQQNRFVVEFPDATSASGGRRIGNVKFIPLAYDPANWNHGQPPKALARMESCSVS